ncbi:unnamed protein product (macronuclear) [Paramecium tetraurelia]|uniref:Uncharacterized protein n=1 Tax=Paramecium tetraurelia TaxID=5888 RepID=A0BP14_PARTE|nr:uncharacterized protein GSPATT00030920001 [Paramecium tetraurelia]CAK60281.1 unnamed protein product [Paramecium tetraurelia]|eukprot:XP_001427679.1 hypothetical protein (macronuclear) [Paramecium tetraurelia strain d4-2]
MKSSKSISSNKTTTSSTSFILNTLQTSRKHNHKPSIQPQQKSTSIMKKPFIMISPKLVQVFDENNTQRTKLLFENRLSLLQTNVQSKSESQIPNIEGQILTSRVRKRTAPIRLSLRFPTQL